MSKRTVEFLSLLSLTDRYERKARLLPGLIVAIPLVLGVMCLVDNYSGWFISLGISAGLGAVLAVGLSHLARAAGKRFEDHTWKKWGGPPTTRWLRHSDDSHSRQQKEKWRAIVSKLTGIDIRFLPSNNDEADRLINDGVRQLRYQLRDRDIAQVVRIHNEDYGFARNLAGLRWVWLLSSVAGLGLCSWMHWGLDTGAIALLILQVVFVLVSAVSISWLPHYVKQCADRYAESLFSVAGMVVDQQSR